MRTGRAAMVDDEIATYPYEVFCGNPLRVATTQRSAENRWMGAPYSRPRGDSDGTHPESRSLPSVIELLNAARFFVLRATPHYAHLAQFHGQAAAIIIPAKHQASS